MGFRRAVVLVITSLALVSAAVPAGAANAATLTVPTVTESAPPRSAAADAQLGSWVNSAVHPVITSIGPDEASAGTGSIVWISGYGFGALTGKAKVQFLYTPKIDKSKAEYISANNIIVWSDTDILCEVPVDNNGYLRSAASGPLTVVDANGVKSEPTGLTVTFGYWQRWQKPEYRFVVRTDDTGWLKMIKAAAKTWTDTDQFTFTYSSKKSTKPRIGNGVNEIYWGKLSSNQTLAVTRTKTPSGGSFPSEADIVFNEALSWGSAMLTKYDVQTLALHEMGHIVGLRDLYGPADKEKAMYGWRSWMGPNLTNWSWGRHRSLTAGDIAGATWIRQLYDAGPEPPPSGLAIGEPYGGGIVAYILRSGDPGYVAGETHGLVAAAADQTGGDGIQWAREPFWYTDVPGALGTVIGSGAANTNAIIAQNGAGTTYAAGLARGYTGGGYNDWFLPSKDELNQLFVNRVAIGGFYASGDWPFYYSSSQDADYALNAWSQNFDVGNQFNRYKYPTFGVRAVRAF